MELQPEQGGHPESDLQSIFGDDDRVAGASLFRTREHVRLFSYVDCLLIGRSVSVPMR